MILAIVLALAPAWAQYPTTPKDYYQFPLSPGEQAFLSGTMGELRSTHFHAGIDIKTKGIEGLKVYAAADGYISRIKITTGGYGHAIYLRHTNGTTSVYAHLRDFREDIQRKVLSTQYEEKSYEVDFYPLEADFPVKRGDLIGWSGNTGSSHGPHLHFEIRDLNQQVLNPLKFHFPNVGRSN
ncbi:MAG: M23 family metallopeptidase, partial [Cytophagales bacterium]|nr:M23 family metallopeptidase [Cytophagales bacterium]